MKYLFKTLLICLLFLSTFAYAQNTQYQIESKSMQPASIQTILEIKNNFGNINLITWDKSTIDLSITLDVEGYDEEEAQQLLKKIKLESSESKNKISFETDLKSFNSSNKKSKSFSVNYNIKIPDGHPIILNNQFGNIFLSDYSGKTSINLEYGNLTAGKLDRIDLVHEFGKATIESFKQANLDLSYVDKFELKDAETIQLEGEYSKLYIDHVNSIKFDLDYGTLKIGEVNIYDGEAEFSALEIDKVLHRFELEAEYAGGVIEINEIGKDVEFFKLETDFSKSEITFEKDSNFNFASEHSFGNLKTNGNNVTISEQIKEATEKSYKGKIGNAVSESSTVINIKTTYGDCTLKSN